MAAAVGEGSTLLCFDWEMETMTPRSDFSRTSISDAQ